MRFYIRIPNIDLELYKLLACFHHDFIKGFFQKLLKQVDIIYIEFNKDENK